MSDDRSSYAPSGRRLSPVVVLAALILLGALLVVGYVVVHHRRMAAVAPAAVANPTPVAALPDLASVVAPTTSVSVAPADPATLANRTAALAAQLATLEARTASVTADAAAASGQAGKAEAMLVAFAARRAIDRGLALGYLEGALRSRFSASQPAAVATVLRGSRQPVTVEDLRQSLDAIGGDLVSGDGWWANVRGELGSLVVLHKTGTPSPLPTERLARARRLLEGGQVEVALAEVARLPGAATAGNWTAAARRWIDVHRALDRLEGAALLGQAATTPIVLPVPVSVPLDAPTVAIDQPAAAPPAR